MITRSITKSFKNQLSRQHRLISTVNKNEVEFFTKLSNHWWDESGEFGLLHKMNPPRVEFILNRIKESKKEDALIHGTKFEENEVCKDLSGLSALDIGCGGGLLSEVCSNYIIFIV